MSTTVKIILGLIAGSVLLCGIVAISGLLLFRSATQAFAGALEDNPIEVQQVAGEILDEIDVPDGFGRGYVVQALGYSVVAYDGEDEHGHIYIIRLPSNVKVDLPDFNSYQRAAGSQDTRPGKMEVVGQEPAVVAGQETMLLISEGANSDGQPYRQAGCVLQDDEGQTLIIYETLVSEWDQAEVDAFFTSIR